MADDDHADCLHCGESGYKTTLAEYATWSAPERAACTAVVWDEGAWVCIDCGAFGIFNLEP